jgi:hypothetical protein
MQGDNTVAASVLATTGANSSAGQGGADREGRSFTWRREGRACWQGALGRVVFHGFAKNVH